MTCCRENNEDHNRYSFKGASGAIRPEVDTWFYVALYVFGTLHLLFSLWMFVEYIIVNCPNFVYPRLQVPTFIYRDRWECMAIARSRQLFYTLVCTYYVYSIMKCISDTCSYGRPQNSGFRDWAFGKLPKWIQERLELKKELNKKWVYFTSDHFQGYKQWYSGICTQNGCLKKADP